MNSRSMLVRLGQPAVAAVAFAFHGARLSFRALEGLLIAYRRCAPLLLRATAAQIYYTGWQGVSLVSLLAVATSGLAFVHSTGGGWMDLGQTTYLLYVVGFKQLATFLTALMVVARSGTAVASELGNMRANREIAVLELMGIDPHTYLLLPRLAGGIVSLVCLSLTFASVCFLSAFVILYTTQEVSFHFYVDQLLLPLQLSDLVGFILKSALNGYAVFLISAQQGLSVKSSAHEVPQVTTRAVVQCILTIIALHTAVELVQYALQGGA